MRRWTQKSDSKFVMKKESRTVVVRSKENEQKRDSTSSEEQVDTSDDLMDVEMFIADYAAEARNRKRPHPAEDDDRPGAREQK